MEYEVEGGIEMPCECTSRKEITDLQKDVAVLQTKMDGVEDDLDSINKKLSSFTWWFIGILTSIIGGMSALLYQLKG